MTWRHTVQAMPDIDQTWMVMGTEDRCGSPLRDDQMPWLAPERRRHFVCGCIDLTPDPTSPCGQLVRCCHLYEMPCGTAKDDHGGIAHRHLPTRCTCGHPIEEAPR